MFDTGGRLLRRGSRRRLISGLIGSAVSEEERDAPVLVTRGDLSRSYPAILTICIRSPWERVPLAAVTHIDMAAWVTRLSAQTSASRCRKSAIRLGGNTKSSTLPRLIER
jgi:hypothetical protein